MFSLLLSSLLALQPAPTLSPASPQEVVSPQEEVLPAPDQIFAVPPELQEAFREQVLDVRQDPNQRLQLLIRFVFDPQRGLGIAYQPAATVTVEEAYRGRKVNCLSSTILIVALARMAGFKAYGQRIKRVLTWGAEGEVVVQTMHANAIVEVARRRYVVDVDASDAISATDALRPVSDQQLVALFYGNRAMELMVEDGPSAAKPWLEAALRQAPEDATLLNNAGVLSLRLGEVAEAERYFNEAIGKDPELMSALANLVAFYRKQGDSRRVAIWEARADKLLRKDPYYQFSIGLRYERNGDLKTAMRQYKRAVSANRGEHRFHFGLARLYYRLGQFELASSELSTAMELSTGNTRGRYQDKLAVLRNMRH